MGIEKGLLIYTRPIVIPIIYSPIPPINKLMAMVISGGCDGNYGEYGNLMVCFLGCLVAWKELGWGYGGGLVGLGGCLEKRVLRL